MESELYIAADLGNASRSAQDGHMNDKHPTVLLATLALAFR